MQNPLTSLDELVWKQFEKVTQYAYKNYGWDKWDLTNIVDQAFCASYLGIGIFASEIGMQTYNPQHFLMAIVGIVGGITMSYGFNQKNKLSREKEINSFLKKGATYKPYFDSFRPTALTIGVTGIGVFLSRYSSLYNYPPLQKKGISTNNEILAYSLIGIAGCFCLIAMQISNYFRTQLPTPPTKKKNLWKIVSDYVTKPFRSLGEKPVEAPTINNYQLAEKIKFIEKFLNYNQL